MPAFLLRIFAFAFVFLPASGLLGSPSFAVAAKNYSEKVDEIRNALPDVYKILGEAGIKSVIKAAERGSPPTDTPVLSQGRLTLSSGVPVTTSDVTAATVIYFTPYHGNKISLYSGTIWQILNFSETSVSVPATTSTPFDIFAYNNGGTLALETVDWSNDSTRATALTTQNGVYVKTGAATRRYLGTGRTTTVSGQTQDSANYRLLWNVHNQETRRLYYAPATNTWSYSAAVARQANGNAAYRVGAVVGIASSNVSLTHTSLMYSGGACYTCLGVDSTTACQAMRGRGGSALTSGAVVLHSETPAAGYHYYQLLEYSDGTVCYFLDYNVYYQLIGSITG